MVHFVILVVLSSAILQLSWGLSLSLISELSHVHISFFTPQRDRLRANLGELRALSQAVTSVSREVAAILDDVRKFQSRCCVVPFTQSLYMSISERLPLNIYIYTLFVNYTFHTYYNHHPHMLNVQCSMMKIKPAPICNIPFPYWYISPPSPLWQFSGLSGFSDLNAELRLLSPENRSEAPLNSFRAFSRIVCGHPEGGVERIPSFNWYEDHDIKSFLGRNGTEQDDMDSDNVTSEWKMSSFNTPTSQKHLWWWESFSCMQWLCTCSCYSSLL